MLHERAIRNAKDKFDFAAEIESDDTACGAAVRVQVGGSGSTTDARKAARFLDTVASLHSGAVDERIANSSNASHPNAGNCGILLNVRRKCEPTAMYHF